MKSDILVYGCARFIGSNICNYFLQHTKFTVAGVDDLKSGHLENLQPALSSKSRFSFLPVSFVDLDITNKVLSLVKAPIAILDFSNYIPQNAMEFLEVLQHNATTRVIVILSSNNFSSHDKFKQKINDINYRLGDMGIVLLEPCEVYGPRQSINDGLAALIFSTLTQSENKLDLSDTKTSWIYVKDLFHNILNCFDNDLVPAGAYALSTDVSASYQDIFNFMRSLVLGNRIVLDKVTVDNFNAQTINAIHHFDLESSIEHTLCWYADNKWAWR